MLQLLRIVLPLVLHHLLQLLLPAVPALSSVSPLSTVCSVLWSVLRLLHDLVLRRVLLRPGVLWSVLRFVLRLWPVLRLRSVLP